jgi:hypothetical protein
MSEIMQAARESTLETLIEEGMSEEKAHSLVDQIEADIKGVLDSDNKGLAAFKLICKLLNIKVTANENGGSGE